MEIVADMSGGSSSVAAKESSFDEVRVLVRAIHRGNQDAVLELLHIVKVAIPADLKVLQAKAEQEARGKEALHKIWHTIQCSRLTRDDRYKLIEFLDAERFRRRNDQLRQVLANVGNC